MGLVFYDYQMAPSPRRARIILAEKQVPHETVQIDMTKAEQLGDAYRAINPNCTIPALKLDDGTILTENSAIAAYLEATYPEPPLLGSTPLEKADIAGWQSKIEGEFAMSVAHAFRNSHPAMKGRALPGPEDYEQIPELSARGLAQIDAFLDKLDARLEGRDFIASPGLSVADITAGVTLDFAKIVKKGPRDTHANIARWHAALRERPSFNL